MELCAAAARAAAVATQQPRTYVIVDRHTGATIGKPYTNARRARSRADKLDNEYGAYRYSVRPVGA